MERGIAHRRSRLAGEFLPLGQLATDLHPHGQCQIARKRFPGRIQYAQQRGFRHRYRVRNDLSACHRRQGGPGLRPTACDRILPDDLRSYRNVPLKPNVAATAPMVKPAGRLTSKKSGLGCFVSLKDPDCASFSEPDPAASSKKNMKKCTNPIGIKKKIIVCTKAGSSKPTKTTTTRPSSAPTVINANQTSQSPVCILRRSLICQCLATYRSRIIKHLC